VKATLLLTRLVSEAYQQQNFLTTIPHTYQSLTPNGTRETDEYRAEQIGILAQQKKQWHAGYYIIF
jgi:hypothetical protein